MHPGPTWDDIPPSGPLPSQISDYAWVGLQRMVPATVSVSDTCIASRPRRAFQERRSNEILHHVNSH